MQITVQKTFDIDLYKERERLRCCFSGEVLERQMALLAEFEKGNFNGFIELYNQLPYSQIDECPEQEYVGLDVIEFIIKCLDNQMKVVKIDA